MCSIPGLSNRYPYIRALQRIKICAPLVIDTKNYLLKYHVIKKRTILLPDFILH
ncbi:unnamed protein product [Meloidogyne enterolobii]|uniref:Uncharacterized protein n=1 Tax=Meloidogyne enterolobii TaxID=390850 RepID=A0ACB0ZM87_MELEN